MAKEIFKLMKEFIQRIFTKHKHHAVYDDKWLQWYCSKCGRQLFYEDLPPKVWKYLKRKNTKRLKKR